MNKRISPSDGAVVVTGASGGIGSATALRFLEEGFHVIGIDRAESAICHPHYVHFVADVSDAESLPELGAKVSVLVNNAGVQGQDDIAVNLRGTINVTRKYGLRPDICAIVNVASASAHTGAEFDEYTASKGGVLAYTKHVALEVAKYGATCNSVSPGGVLTDLNRPVMEYPEKWDKIMELTPLKKWATKEEIADWIFFLAIVNRSMTGQDVLVDNGEAGNATFVW